MIPTIIWEWSNLKHMFSAIFTNHFTVDMKMMATGSTNMKMLGTPPHQERWCEVQSENYIRILHWIVWLLMLTNFWLHKHTTTIITAFNNKLNLKLNLVCNYYVTLDFVFVCNHSEIKYENLFLNKWVIQCTCNLV